MDIKNCPFCGGKVEVKLAINEASGTAICNKCGARSAHIWKSSIDESTSKLVSKILNAWNQRTEKED